ncbi:hypothetical protein V2J09_010275 [Rumex salicifolius]
MSQNNWEADKMLDVYIHDYFMKRKLLNSAKTFQQEAKVSTDPVAIDAPGGFLFEWWSVFWDIFIARTNDKHSEAAASYNESQISKAREAQQMQQQKSQQQMHMQQILMQRQLAQQQQMQQGQPQQGRDASHLLNGNANGIASNDNPLMRQNPGTANALATKMIEDKLKLPLQRDPSDDHAMKQRFGDSGGQLLDPTHASMLKSPAVVGQTPGQALHGTPGGMSGNLQQFQNRNQQLPLSATEIKNEVNPMPNTRVAAPEGSLMGVPGGSSLPLKGWPLTGLDTLRIQQQKSMMQSPQPFNQMHIHQQLLLQAQQNLASPSLMDIDARKMRMLSNCRSMGLGKDGQLIPIDEVVPNVGSPVQVGCPVLPRSESDMLMKQQMQNSQIPQQNSLSSQQAQILNQLHQPDKVGGAGSMTMDGSMSNSFRGHDQAAKNQLGRKRKQPVSSSGPANSTGTANTTGPSPSSAPSTPSTHTPGDVMSMPNLQHNGVSSKPISMFGSDPLTSGPNQLADMGRFVDDATLDDNVESFLSQEEADPRDSIGRGIDAGKGPLKEITCIAASADKVTCCHFSLDGKLLATGGRDKKAVLWSTDTHNPKSFLEEHTHAITDVRFSASVSRLATSSFDRTVRVWDADNPGYSLRNFTGHSAAVMSLDCHPIKDDLICSCDDNGEIRYWSINNGSCRQMFRFENGMTQVRFQPRVGKYFAAAAENYISLYDVETHTRVQALQGHTQKVQSLCWDVAGECLASVSEDLVRVWTNLELWDMAENRTMMMPVHDGLVTALSASVTGMVASASHDKYVKLWK